MSTDAVVRGSSRYPFNWRRLAAAGLLMGVAYGGALLVSAPAAVIGRVTDLPPQVLGMTGTLWQGQALLQDGFAAEWDVDVAASLRALRLMLDWTIIGSDTRLAGRASLSSLDAEVSDIKGVADWTLATALLGELPVQCDLTARVNLDRMAVAPGVLAADGALTIAAGACAAEPGTAPVDIPALHAKITTFPEGIAVTVARQDTPDVRLGSIEVLTEGRMIATMLPAGARLVPGMPSSAPATIEIPLALTIPPPPER